MSSTALGIRNKTVALLAALLLADNNGPINQAGINLDATTITTKGVRSASMNPAAIKRLHTEDTSQSISTEFRYREAFQLAKFLREVGNQWGPKQYRKDGDLVKQAKGDPVAVLITRHFESYKHYDHASNYVNFLNGGKLNTNTALQLINLRIRPLLPRDPQSSQWLALEDTAYKTAPNLVRTALKEKRLTNPKEFWHQATALATCGKNGSDMDLAFERFVEG